MWKLNVELNLIDSEFVAIFKFLYKNCDMHEIYCIVHIYFYVSKVLFYIYWDCLDMYVFTYIYILFICISYGITLENIIWK